MSNVTDCILLFDIMEDEEFVACEVNCFFLDDERQQFMCPADVKGAVGGYKQMQQPVMMSAINYLDEDGFIEHLRSIEWREPNKVQLLLCREDDSEFELIYPCRKSP